jgi:hypothetical protein
MFMRLYLVFKDRESHGLSESITNPRCRSQSLISRTNKPQARQRAVGGCRQLFPSEKTIFYVIDYLSIDGVPVK